MILVLVDDNSKLSGKRKHDKNHAFAKACREKVHHISPMRQFFTAAICSSLSDLREEYSGGISD